MSLVNNLLLVVLLSTAVTSDLDVRCQEDSSTSYLHGHCEDGREKVKLYKSEATEYKICPSARSCFQKGSEVYMNSTRGLYLEDFAVLKVFEKASFRLVGNSFLKLSGRSFFATNGTFHANGMFASITFRSEIVNHGFINVGESCDLEIYYHSSVFLDVRSQFIIQTFSTIRVSRYSRLSFDWHQQHQNVNNHSELLLLQNHSTLKINDGSAFHLVNGKVLLKKSSIVLHTQSAAYVDGLLVLSNENRITLDKQSELFIGRKDDPGSDVFVDEDGAGSLMFAAKELSLNLGHHTELIIKASSHCLVIKSCVINVSITLDTNSKTECFRCFGNRKDLMSVANFK